MPVHPTCGHRRVFLCALLTMNDVKRFHEAFYAVPEKSKQDAFLLKFCRRASPNPKRKLEVAQRGKDHIYEYSILNSVGNHLKVCRNAFLNVLGISKHRIHGVFQRFKKHNALVPIETRGGDRLLARYTPKRNAVIEFICSLKANESHYSRERSKRVYLPSELNIKTLWKMYNNVDRPEDQLVKESYFRKIFNTEFNIGFKAPSMDECSTCIEFDHRIAIEKDEEVKKELQFKRTFHRKQGDAFFEYLRKKPDDVFILSFDCQKNLVLPKITDQIAYYSRQLYCYNLSITRGVSTDHLNPHTVSIYTWTENEAKKSSNEIASAVFSELMFHNLAGYRKIRLVADGCPGQNKNVNILYMVAKWLSSHSPPTISEVELIYPVTGHSFLPADRVFGTIERQLKKLTTIITKQEYHKVFQKLGTIKLIGKNWKPYDWKKVAKENMKSASQLHFKISSCKRIIVRKTTRNNIVIRGELAYNTNTGCERQILKKNGTLDINPPEIPLGVPVKAEKFVDVEKLLTKHFGAAWKEQKELEWYKSVLDGTTLTEGQADEQCDCFELEEWAVDEPAESLLL